jgi:hypothetical protein
MRAGCQRASIESGMPHRKALWRSISVLVLVTMALYFVFSGTAFNVEHRDNLHAWADTDRCAQAFSSASWLLL